MKHRPYYQIVEDVLARSIAEGDLPAGTHLMASPLAERLSVSRPPVTRALQALADKGLILPVEGRGYMVPGTPAPVKRNLHELPLSLGEEGDRDSAPVLPGWGRILEDVAAQVLDCMPFGTFMISESGIGQHFGVSRTVVRDVLSRLQARGMVRKDRQSHWVAGPLSARMLDDAQQLRRRLEPLAVASAIATLPRPELTGMRERIRMAISEGAALSQPQVDRLEADLHQRCLEAASNRLLWDMVRPLQLSHVVDRLFGTYIGVHDVMAMLVEHRLVLDHMLIGDRSGAEAAMRFHLDADHERARARLKVLSIFDDPDVAPYLIRIH